MSKRAQILAGMGAGMLWAFALFFITGEYLGPPRWGAPVYVIGAALLPGGVVLCLMIGRLAQRRFFDDQIIDGQPFPDGSKAHLDQSVLTNTVEQLVLAVCLWPFIWNQLGDAVVGVLGWSFAATRLMFWAGYHCSPPMRALGFAAGFYPTLLFTAFSVLFLFIR